MKPNPKAIEALKRVMTLDQRKEFVEECEKYNGKDFLKNCDYKTTIEFCKNLPNHLTHPFNSFMWIKSKKGFDYWADRMNSLTYKERSLKLFIK